MDDGKPFGLCDDFSGALESIGCGGSSHGGGLIGFFRHPFRYHHPDDAEHQLARNELFLSRDDMKNSGSTSTLSSDSSDISSAKQPTGSSALGMGRSSTWASFRYAGTSHDKPHAGLPTLPEVSDSAAVTNQSLSSSKSYHILPAVSSFATLPSSGEQRTMEKPSFSIGDKSDIDSHSFFGLPSRIKVTKRELNMMTPSSF